MSFNESEGLKNRDTLKIGLLELSWMQDHLGRRRRARKQIDMSEPGFLARHGGNSPLPDFGWTVYDRDGDGILRLKAYDTPDTDMDPRELWTHPVTGQQIPIIGAAVDEDGHVLEIPLVHDLDIGITLADDGVDRVIVVRAVADAERRKEPGTLTITGASSTVIGVNTRFTDLIGASDANNPIAISPRGMKIRIDAGDTGAGNDGEYEIDTIVSDTELTLVTPIPSSESGVPFRIAGDFFVAPAAPGDTDIHTQIRPEFVLLADSVGEKLSDGMIAFRVQRRSGTTYIIDRRPGQLWRPFRQPPIGYYPQLTQVNADDWLGGDPATDPFTSRTYWRTLASTSVGGVADSERCAVCLADDDGGTIMFAIGDVSGNIEVGRVLRDGGPATNPSGANYPYVQVDGAGTAFNPSLLRLPAGDPFDRTHLIFYDKADTIVMRSTTDHGLTWSSESVIWDGTSTFNGLSHPCALLTLDMRIIVVASWLDLTDNATGLSFIYSDQLATGVGPWETNSDSGFLMITRANNIPGAHEVTHPSIAQDDGGNIFVAYRHAPATTVIANIHLFRGVSPNDPRPSLQIGGDQYDDDAPVGATYVGEVISPTPGVLDATTPSNRVQFGAPALWVAPDGGILCFYSAAKVAGFVDDHQFIWCSTVHWYRSQARILRVTQMRGWDAGSQGNDWGGAVCQANDGTLQLVHAEAVPAGTHFANLVPVLPVPMNRTRRLADYDLP